LFERDFAVGLALLDEDQSQHGSHAELESLRIKLHKRRHLTDDGAPPPVRLKSTTTDELRAWAERTGVPTGDVDGGALRVITEAGDILMERAPGSRALVIVFGGLATMFGGAAEDLGFLVQEKKVNALFLSDPKRLFLLDGLISVGGYPETIAWIKELAETWTAPNIYCLGFSAGGYAALRYGVDLGARRILTFAGATMLTPTLSQVDKRGTALLNRILTRKPDMCLNMRDYLMRLGANAPEIINYYGAKMPEDTYHARNLEGLPTVELRQVEAVDTHAVVAGLRKSKLYAEILRGFLHDSET